MEPKTRSLPIYIASLVLTHSIKKLEQNPSRLEYIMLLTLPIILSSNSFLFYRLFPFSFFPKATIKLRASAMSCTAKQTNSTAKSLNSTAYGTKSTIKVTDSIVKICKCSKFTCMCAKLHFKKINK